MSVSLPSKEVYSFDVPEVKSFTAQFKYNFFTPDEKITETSEIPRSLSEKSPTELGTIADDTSQLDFVSLKIPRWVRLSWKLPKIRFKSSEIYDELNRNSFPLQPSANFISSNIDKIIYEDRVKSNAFLAITFQDANADLRLYETTSGSYELNATEVIDNATQKALYAEELAPVDVNPSFMTTAMAQPELSLGVSYDDYAKSTKKEEYLDKLKKVAITTQLSVKAAPSLLKLAAGSSWSPTREYFSEIVKKSSTIEQLSRQTIPISEDDYKTFVPYVSVAMQKGSSKPNLDPPRLVGYIVHKYEILDNGETRNHSDIILESPRIASTLDVKVKYGTIYYYTVRAVYLMTISAVDDATKDIALIKLLVASKPSQKEFVTCEEFVAPPPPADFKVIWDYDRPNARGQLGSLMLTWSFPPTFQRDVKKFHVLRRESVDHPFEVLRVFDFDDSESLTEDAESYDDRVIVKNLNPQLYFYDDEFTKNSKYIYAVSCQDAHGFISTYSAQFEVKFDVFKNSLQKTLVSPSGAPRVYPNLFLLTDLFVDTMHVSGDRSKTLSICFDPEYYTVLNNKGDVVSQIATEDVGAKYRIQFINVDNQKDGKLDIVLSDLSNVTK